MLILASPFVHNTARHAKGYTDPVQSPVQDCGDLWKIGFELCAFKISFFFGWIQERATKISHGNTARHAKDYGDPVLGKICGHIASDEGRHEIAYQRIVEKFFEL